MNESAQIWARARTVLIILFAGLGLAGLESSLTTVAQAQAVEGKPLGHLFWGIDPATGNAWNQVSLERSMQRGDDAAFLAGNVAAKVWIDSGRSFSTVQQITIEGHLPGQPSFDRSVDTTREMKMLVPLALCARGSPAQLQAECQRAASAGVFAWMRAYSAPTGNPIDESNLLPLFLATDLLEDTWTASQKAEAGQWLEIFLTNSAMYRDKELKHPAYVSYGNFESWRLMLNLVAATIAGKKEKVQQLTLLWREQIDLNVGQDGRTWDLRRRGSLHYQDYDLEPMIWLRLFVPSAFTPKEDRLVQQGLMYLQPYYEGSKTYIEFAHPDLTLGQQIVFDVTRRKAGMPEFQLKDWDRADAHLLLHLAAAVYPAIRPWVVKDRADNYPIMVQQIVAMHHRDVGACAARGASAC